jgi:membrane-associated HD superfamily phosphohydrolase
MVVLNLFNFSLVDFAVDILINAAWLLPLFFVVKNVLAYLSAPAPIQKVEARKELIKSIIVTAIMVFLVILFNLLIRPNL